MLIRFLVFRQFLARISTLQAGGPLAFGVYFQLAQDALIPRKPNHNGPLIFRENLQTDDKLRVSTAQ